MELNGLLDSLEQSVLARAFRGELGTGDDDEQVDTAENAPSRVSVSV